jgi:sigma-E factor negative regulatory protein RseC
MLENGKVIKAEGIDALVEVNCYGCKSCAARAFCTGGERRIVQVENKIGAKVGDKVMLEIPRRGFYLSLTLIFIIPMILLCGGFLIFNHLLGEAVSGLVGLLLPVLWFVILRQIDKSQKNNAGLKPKIVQTIDTDEQG